jgi:hypothetical protein
MKLTKIAASSIATIFCLTPLAPAFAGPLDSYRGSILDPSSSTLSTNPQALCSDIVKADETESKSGSASTRSEQKNATDEWNRSQNDAKSSGSETSAGGSFMGISANYGSKKNSSSQNSSTDAGKTDNSRTTNSTNQRERYNKTSTNRAVGKDCGEFVKAAANRDAAAYAADAQVQMVRSTNEAKLKAQEVEANSKLVESLTKW